MSSICSLNSVADGLILGWVPGTMELLIIAGVALLLFGHRLPSVMRNLGRGVVEFKKGIHDDGSDEEPAVSEVASREAGVQKG